MRKIFLVLAAAALFTITGCRQAPNSEIQPTKVAYKTVEGRELFLHVFEPQDKKTNMPAFVLFHGGGWFMGDPNGFYPHCKYFAAKGMVAISVQYRLNKDGNSPPFASVEDAKSAIRFVRSHAWQFGINPERIAAGGASAGGHLAASTALFEKYDAPEDLKISSKPDALVLISAAFDTTPNGIGTKILEKFKKQFTWIYGPDANDFSPINHIKKISSPCLILHGTADDIVPIESAKRFCDLMQKEGNSCLFIAIEGAGHGFSIYKENGQNQQYEEMMRIIEEFFYSKNYFTSFSKN